MRALARYDRDQHVVLRMLMTQRIAGVQVTVASIGGHEVRTPIKACKSRQKQLEQNFRPVHRGEMAFVRFLGGGVSSS
jgi:hypothetical protein